MKRSPTSIAIQTCIAASLIAPLACTGPDDTLPDDSPRKGEILPPEDIARDAVAAREGVDPSDLELLATSPAHFQYAELDGHSFKFITESTGQVFGATIADRPHLGSVLGQLRER